MVEQSNDPLIATTFLMYYCLIISAMSIYLSVLYRILKTIFDILILP